MSETRMSLLTVRLIEGNRRQNVLTVGEMLIEQNETNEIKEVKPSTSTKHENLCEQQTNYKPVITKIIHVVSLWACIILAFSGCWNVIC